MQLDKDSSVNLRHDMRRILKTYSAPKVTILTPDQVRSLLGDKGAKQPLQKVLEAISVLHARPHGHNN
jgi:hypothetical protein